MKYDIQKYLDKGYQVINETSNFVMLEKPKKFSILAFVMWTIFTFFGGIVYVLYYFTKKKDVVTVHKT